MAEDTKKAAEKAAKKEARAAKRAERKQNYKQLWTAFNMQRKEDKALIPIVLSCILGMGLLFFLLGMLFNAEWFMMVLGLFLGLALALFVFTKRLEKSMYAKVGDQPGVAGWTLENLKNGIGVVWKTKTGVAMNTHMDLVHRVIGAPGVVLVGEGEPHRLKPMFNQLKKRLNRLVRDVPVYEMVVGDGDDQVPVRKLQRELLKLPRNYKKDAVYAIAAKVEAMDNVGSANPTNSLPKGPLPKGGKISGMNRRARRLSERNKNH